MGLEGGFDYWGLIWINYRFGNMIFSFYSDNNINKIFYYLIKINIIYEENYLKGNQYKF